MKKIKCRYVFLVAILLLLGIRVMMNLSIGSRSLEIKPSECVFYYLLNIDGMKGLGHSAFLLVDEQGEGVFYSYNGMQYSLSECLAGKAGVGKMKEFQLTAEEVAELLDTGNLQVSDVSECDNFDRILYRSISGEEYRQIQENIKIYIQVGEEFEQFGEVITEMAEVPLYQIYHHNCDTVAREQIALVDTQVAEYNETRRKLTPARNYKGMCRYMDSLWGYGKIGSDSFVERVLWYFL